MSEFLQGKKTYIASGALALFAVLGLITGQLDSSKAIELIVESGVFAALRAGIANAK